MLYLQQMSRLAPGHFYLYDYSMVIFLYGEDSFRSSQKMRELKNKYLEKDETGSGLSVFSAEEKIKVRDIFDVMMTSNLFALKRLVILKNFISGLDDENQKILLELLKKNKKNLIEEKEAVIVFWEEAVPKKTNALFKLLSREEQVKKQEFSRLVGSRLENWIMKKMKEIDSKAVTSKIALTKLISFCGSDMYLLEKEIEKLVDYADGKMISEKEVDLLVRSKIDSNIFATIDALSSGNKKESLKLISEHITRGDDPFYIFSMITYQFRNLLKVAGLFEEGIRNEYEISKIAKLHPFVVRKSLAASRNLSFSKLKGIYRKLADIDVGVKTGKFDIRLAIDKFIVEL